MFRCVKLGIIGYGGLIMINLINGKEKWGLLYDFIMGLDYGNTITHNEISEIIQESPKSPKYYSIITKVKKELLKEGKTVKSISGHGYFVINPDEYTDLSLDHMKKGFNQVDKGYQVLQYAPTSQMSEEGLQRHRHISDKAQSLKAMVAGGCVELKLLNRKSRLKLTDER